MSAHRQHIRHDQREDEQQEVSRLESISPFDVRVFSGTASSKVIRTNGRRDMDVAISGFTQHGGDRCQQMCGVQQRSLG